ncbi:hypothetical protein [Sulfitobacter geojensis]|uniref:hypothetical protein n=1 Tax=Sulfitobacter geojensis TaxID=1342299 RepID=UPI0004692098|nr:hypothetical protein [Sulfitobacter geojensis]KHA51132.1 Regulatory protein SoxS [Sulfitobacter geojensis]NYI26502.1 thioredoxin-related protein [Sulfitobacter geojensis]
MSFRLFLMGALLLVASAFSAVADTRLIMVEEDGCMWCARWNEEIADIYPKTDAGKAAPLRRMDIHAPLPDDLAFSRKLVFTPTFVLMVDGKEVSRLEGYPGEDFFWGIFEKMLADARRDITG